MDPSLYHRFFEVEDRHWWFVGRRRVVGALMEQALGSPGSGSRSGLPLRAGASSQHSASTADVAGERGGAPPARRILDVGCGTGGMLPLLSRFGHVTGTDSEPLALDYCRRRGFEDVHLQEAFTAPAPFDVVTLFDVLEHVPDHVGFLEWIRKLLKPDGHLVLTVPAFPFLWSRHDDLNHHQRRYKRADLKATLEAGGFRVERLTYFNFWLFPAAVATRARGGKAESVAGRTTDPAAGRTTVDPAAEAAEILKPLQIGAANPVLAAVLGSEAGLVRQVDLPWGVSLAAVARPAR
ncbi:MAG TPA: class I SAM-dependent methyltransferase [Candidatus Eisenbacteria bacterium]